MCSRSTWIRRASWRRRSAPRAREVSDMSRRFEVETCSTATMDQVMGAFASPDYWAARFHHFGGGLDLTSLDVDGAGAVMVEVVQDVARTMMHPLLAAMYPRDIRVIAVERWVPVGARVEGAITVDVQGAPGSGVASARLRPTETGCQLYVTGDVRVRVPVVGGPIERLVAGQVKTHVPDIQRFTGEWALAHG
ncbi:DUF2505 domain-containing protein [Tsukamurella strandjordii]